MSRLTELAELLRTGVQLTREPSQQNEHLAAWRRSVRTTLARKPGRQPKIDHAALTLMLKTRSQAEAARRLGVTRQAIHQALEKGSKEDGKTPGVKKMK